MTVADLTSPTATLNGNRESLAPFSALSSSVTTGTPGTPRANPPLYQYDEREEEEERKSNALARYESTTSQETGEDLRDTPGLSYQNGVTVNGQGHTNGVVQSLGQLWIPLSLASHSSSCGRCWVHSLTSLSLIPLFNFLNENSVRITESKKMLSQLSLSTSTKPRQKD